MPDNTHIYDMIYGIIFYILKAKAHRNQLICTPTHYSFYNNKHRD